MTSKKVFEVNTLFAKFVNDETHRLGLSFEKVYAKTGIRREAFWTLKSQM